LRVLKQTLHPNQIPIVAGTPRKPRVRSLAGSGRRPGCPRLRLAWPASGTLHRTGLMHHNKIRETEYLRRNPLRPPWARAKPQPCPADARPSSSRAR
jgi:hypothetical protein